MRLLLLLLRYEVDLKVRCMLMRIWIGAGCPGDRRAWAASWVALRD